MGAAYWNRLGTEFSRKGDGAGGVEGVGGGVGITRVKLPEMTTHLRTYIRTRKIVFSGGAFHTRLSHAQRNEASVTERED
ncbi:hypothetical protein TNCT_666621 [Trichonephila clavata]|uniref:Uncharacterized protein n=1 Tax=Trichonephila clavata TaxID=2740835 RepID=A0A8X6G3D9_TRICU|nr:hypothetical protein TNCT_666621 [Trichonephila clavata]